MLSDKPDVGVFQPIIGSWYESLRNPLEFQRRVLLELVKGYCKTRYGKSCRASEVEGVEDFRARFLIIGYRELNPYLIEVQKGDFSAILPEPLFCWVMTRGSTGPAKVIPATRTHLNQILTCGARALVNYAFRKKDYEILMGKILNLNFPSQVHTMIVGDKKITYGYSSGTYAKINPTLEKGGLWPPQEEIDALGSGIARADWERRFELVYQRALEENVTAAMGVTPVILAFARYIKKKHGKKPKEIWKFHALFCTSVRKIHFKYAPILRKYFGNVSVVEIYSATEGVFAQQLDELPYVTPNYDKYFFEVVLGGETKMLCELKRGEWGRLVISSCLFPRYDIGDLIEAAGKNYFRVIGRCNTLTLLEHRLYRLFFGWFL
ncbi:MAG: GH3 auxin-responsive promoter family protein [Candidatus Bathyarchaeia archaeon]